MPPHFWFGVIILLQSKGSNSSKRAWLVAWPPYSRIVPSNQASDPKNSMQYAKTLVLIVGLSAKPSKQWPTCFVHAFEVEGMGKENGRRPENENTKLNQNLVYILFNVFLEWELRQDLAMKPCWPQTHSNLSALVSWVLGLWVYAPYTWLLFVSLCRPVFFS